MQDKRIRYNEGRSKLPRKGTVTIVTNHVDKILRSSVCKKCKKEGMAYEDPNNPKQKPHLCMECKK